MRPGERRERPLQGPEAVRATVSVSMEGPRLLWSGCGRLTDRLAEESLSDYALQKLSRASCVQ